MKAAVTTQWGSIALQDLPVPEPGPGESLIRLKLAGICGSDTHIFQGHHPTAVSPVVQGHEFVGTLERIGGQAAATPTGATPTGAKPGDRVVVEPLISCHACEACRVGHWHVCRNLKLLGIHTHGGFAEYVKVPTAKVIRVPDAVPDRLAALTEPFAVGFHVNQRGELRNGDRALVIGAGPIGLIIGMVAKLAGAQVTFSEVRPERLAAAHAHGFEAHDARELDAQRLLAITGGDGFDVVYEAAGVKASVEQAIEAARVRGRIVQVGIFGKPVEVPLTKILFREQTLIGSRVYTFEDFRKTVTMLERIVTQKLFDLDALIAETCGLGDVQSGIEKMIAGEADGKILVDLAR